MRLILPIILIALMLLYATSDDEPSREWLIPPDPNINVFAAAPAPGVSPIDRIHRPATQPAQPATQPTHHTPARH